MKTYSNKSNARRAAKAAGLGVEAITFVQNAEGWYWEAIETPVVDQVVAEAIAEVDTRAEDAALAQLEVACRAGGKSVMAASAAAQPVTKYNCAEEVVVTAAKIARREHPSSADPRTDRIAVKEQFLKCLVKVNPEHSSNMAKEIRARAVEFAKIANVSEETVQAYASIIETELVLQATGNSVATAKQGAPKQSKGLKIERNRDEQNGVKRPSVGSTCRQLWDMFDAMYAEKGIVPTPAPAKAKSAEQGMSPVTTTVQLYQWRAFMGFKGR